MGVKIDDSFAELEHSSPVIASHTNELPQQIRVTFGRLKETYYNYNQEKKEKK
jgi:hypothetical protein